MWEGVTGGMIKKVDRVVGDMGGKFVCCGVGAERLSRVVVVGLVGWGEGRWGGISL